MRENFTYGSVRGAASNGGPYRDRRSATTVTYPPPAVLSFDCRHDAIDANLSCNLTFRTKNRIDIW